MFNNIMFKYVILKVGRFDFKYKKIISLIKDKEEETVVGMTIVEQILAKKSKREDVKPGENVWVNVDVLMTHDVTGPGSMSIFKKHFGENAKVWNN